ncbi:MAG: carboxypeptidase-like regulatory domain-containing protein [Blastocatellia bacterium]|nr:carboxypeptidase-like regulatory domain-containing protein [Blastocatellia bacterium]
MKLISRYALFVVAVLILWPAPRGYAQTGGIRGKVKEQGGKSLEDVLVRAIHAKNKENTHEARTDAKGDFELTGLPGGEYSLSFEKQGFKNFTTRKLEVIPGETIRLSRVVEISREGDPYALIRGAVLYGVGYSLPNATVTIERIDGEKRFKQETISREGGEFAFRLRPEKAKYRISAAARGFQSASTEIEILSDEVRNVALTLQQVK